MSAPNCLRGLVRPSATIPISAPRTAAPRVAPIALVRSAPFSTTAINARRQDPNQQGGGGKGHVRQGKKLKLGKFKKNAVESKGKPPLPGERKAYRKRITLSNDNAIPVPWLKDLDADDLASAKNIARVLALPEEVQDQLRASEAFKPTQCWGMFRKPSLLVRKESVDLMNRMQASVDRKQTLRLVVTGDKVTGKSMMLLQAMAHAFLNNWIVIHVPEGQELTTACTEYAPIPNTEPVQYMQPVYVLKLLQAIKRANEKILAKTYTVSGHPELPQNITPNTPLLALCNAAKEPDSAWPVFQALWNELTAQGANRPPILLSLDGLAHVMRVSDYRSPAFELIHSHDLALVRLFTDALGGAVHFSAGGAVLAATSRNNAPRSPSMELSLAQREAEQTAGKEAAEVPQKDPFFRGYDDRVEAVLRSVQVLRLGGVSKLEARALMEYWAASGMLRATVDEKTVTEKWTLAGSGVLGEMERAALLTMRI
ncbi:mitochondrial ribosomal death-associated protein 3-domain-containing protein [Achaetomium macrosporum]|uniref:Small ribosomal subunit protein mS29 n=1 Tax=Achaetomium macrosporum TaxID=79813 RepID=A0AAN7CFQ4_9PEZI|nr:mitochondrial ribosomal death-associated protein 3-domain-containing protein [Achaetomium macrosporum]